MEYFSLFSGIGGFELGIRQADNGWGNARTEARKEKLSPQRTNIERQRNREGGERTPKPTSFCVGYSEIDKWADAIYRYHFPDHRNYGDARGIVPGELPEFGLLVGGFPCQAFSLAGKRRGFGDTRGTLFFEICRILGGTRPKYLLLENVKGLLSHDRGRTFLVILESLEELGYDLQWQVLNSKDFGVPQNRERVFIIGHLRGECRPQVFPIGEDGEGEEDNRTDGKQTVYAIDSGYGKGCYSPGKTNSRTMIIQNMLHLDHNNQSGFVRGIKPNVGHDFSNLLMESPEIQQMEIAGTLTGGGHSGGLHSDMTVVLEQDRIRRLTPIECERLQGFPDGWTKYGIIDGKKVEISDTQRYKCLGNAVTVNVVSAIVSRLLKK